jgi:hypothetical protein
MMDRGELADGKTVCSLLMALRRGLLGTGAVER